jgi:LemA protein
LFLFSIIALLLIIVWRFNNKAVTLKEDANNRWGDVESSYQRRYDLIDNLVATVKGYADHEKKYFGSCYSSQSQCY